MTPAELAARYTIVTPVGTYPVAFSRDGEPVTEEQFIRDCWAEGVDPFVAARLCERSPAEPQK